MLLSYHHGKLSLLSQYHGQTLTMVLATKAPLRPSPQSSAANTVFTPPSLQTNMIMLFMPHHAQHVNSQMCLHWSRAHLCAVTSMVSKKIHA